jgi:hypothetical protein
VRKQKSPGQSAASPWVIACHLVEALQGRNIRGTAIVAPLQGFSKLGLPLPRAALRSALGFHVCAPSVLERNITTENLKLEDA